VIDGLECKVDVELWPVRMVWMWEIDVA
jgi:hypothetical protein